MIREIEMKMKRIMGKKRWFWMIRERENKEEMEKKVWEEGKELK